MEALNENVVCDAATVASAEDVCAYCLKGEGN